METPMRIAFLPDDYLPDSTLVHAKMIHELALEFQKYGHETVVITPGTIKQPSNLVIDTIDEVEIWRFKSGETRGVGNVKRAINESLLSFRAWFAIRNEVKKKPFDLCINYSPTIFFGPLVRLIKGVNPQCKSYLVLRDLFPQWIIDEGIISANSLPAKYFRFFERYNYKSSDRIGLMSEANLEYFNIAHSDIANTEILRNWSRVIPVEVNKKALNVRDKYHLKDKVILFYGGNIGIAQDMTNIMRLAKNLIGCEQAHVLIVGQGDEFELIQHLQRKWQLENVTILPSVDQGTYKQLLKQVDIGLFSLAKSHKAHNFPGKIMGYMLESLPILGSVNVGNDLLQLVNEKNTGFAFINGEDESLAEAALTLINSQALRKQKGLCAFEVLNQYFSVESAAVQMLKLIDGNGCDGELE